MQLPGAAPARAPALKLLFLSAFLLTGPGTFAAPPADKSPRGTCYVCKYNNDLACVNFRLKPETPKVVYEGQTYVFCGTDCRDAFLKRPQKYLPKK